MKMDDGPILICYDGSDGAKRAIEAAAGLLTERHAAVLDVAPFLTLEESVGTAGGPMGVDFETLNKEAALERANEGLKIAQGAGFTADARAEQASTTWEGVAGVAREIDARVIVIAGSGLSGLSETVKGKVPRTVTEHAGRPVLLVQPPHSRPARTPDGPLLICYDDSESAKRVIEAAASLLTERRAVVLLVAPILSIGEALSWVGVGPADYETKAKDAAHESLDAGAKIAREAGFDAEARIKRADATWEGVAGEAAEIGAAAIVIAGTGLSGLSETVKGKVPRTIAEHAGRPVLLVPPPHSRSKPTT
jgi:nucleotide-binding universal stress UspA family protein